MHGDLGTCPTSDIYQVTVMGRDDDLAGARHGGEQPAGFLGAEIIEGLEDVVCDERQGRAGLCELMVAGDPKSEVELGPGARRHVGGQFRATRSHDAQQDFLLAAGLGRQSRIGALGDCLECV